MTHGVDLTQPGPAGLYFRTDHLTPAALAADRAARARLEAHCTICGTIPAPYGFGRHRACDEPSCRIEAETRMEADRGAVEAPTITAGPSQPTNPTDLFNRPEAA